MKAEHSAELFIKQCKKLWLQYRYHLFAFVSTVLILYTSNILYSNYLDKREHKAATLYYELVYEQDPLMRKQKAEQFVAKYSHDPYTPWANLILMKFDFDQQNWQGMDFKSEQILKTHAPVALKDNTYLLLARRDLVQKNYDQALRNLDNMSQIDNPLKYYFRALIAVEKNDKENARTNIGLALQAFSQIQNSDHILKSLWYLNSKLEE